MEYIIYKNLILALPERVGKIYLQKEFHVIRYKVIYAGNRMESQM